MKLSNLSELGLPLTEAELEQINRHETRPAHIDKLWNYYVRKGLAAEVLAESPTLLAAPS